MEIVAREPLADAGKTLDATVRGATVYSRSFGLPLLLIALGSPFLVFLGFATKQRVTRRRAECGDCAIPATATAGVVRWLGSHAVGTQAVNQRSSAPALRKARGKGSSALPQLAVSEIESCDGAAAPVRRTRLTVEAPDRRAVPGGVLVPGRRAPRCRHPRHPRDCPVPDPAAHVGS